LGIGDWGLGIVPNPQSPIPNPQLTNYITIILYYYNILKLYYYINIYIYSNNIEDNIIQEKIIKKKFNHLII